MNHPLSKVFSVALFAIFFTFQSLAQSNDLLDKGNKYFELKDYKQAINTYLEVLEQNPNESAVYGQLANCYRFINDMQSAEQWYLKAVQLPRPEAEHFFQYGKVLQMLGKYKMAEAYFTEYSKIDPVKGKAYATSARFAAQRQSDAPFYTVTKEIISSSSDDFGVSVYRGKIIYASSRTDLKNENNDNDAGWKSGKLNQLLIAQPGINNSLGQPKVLKTELKASTKEGPLSFTADGRTVAYTQNQFVDGVRQIPEVGFPSRIYLASVVSDDEWQQEKPFAYNNPEKYNTSYPSLTSDGSAIYFASDMPGGFGGTDIYVCYKTGDSWSAPQNLGEGINTAGDEISPYFHNNVLYFSSNYLPGFGGMDIYQAENIDGKWSRVSHLGTGINSSSDDYGLVFYENGIGYLVSNREGSADIYKAEISSERIVIAILDDRGQAIPNVSIDFSACGEEPVLTDNEGRLKFIAKRGLDCQGVVVSKTGYESKIIRVSSANQNLRILEVRLMREANIENRYIGTVVDANTKSPISNVKISVTNLIDLQKNETFSDKDGKYSLTLEAGTTYKISYLRSGYVETSRNVLVGDGTNKALLSVQLLQPTNAEMLATKGVDVQEYSMIDGASLPNYDEVPEVGYDVQFGVFSNPNKDVFTNLRGLGFIYSQRKSPTLKAYKVGAFRTRAEAEAVRNQIQSLGYPEAYITTITDKNILSRVLIRNNEPIKSVPLPTTSTTVKQSPPKPNFPLTYRVQLGAYNNPAYFDKSTVDGMGELSYIKTASGVTLVLLGNFKTYQEAKVMEAKVKERGGLALVVAVQNGKKIPLSQVDIQ